MATILADYQAAQTNPQDRAINITAGQYVMVYAGCTGTAAATAAATASLFAGSGLVLTKIGEHAPALASSCECAAWGGFATATGAVTVRVTFSSLPADGFTYIEAEDLIDTTTPFYGVSQGPANSGTDATHPALTLATAPIAADRVRGLFVMRNKTAAATAGTGSLIKAGFKAAPCAGLLLEGGTGLTGTAVVASNMGVIYNAGIAFVLKSTAAPGVADVYVWNGSTLVASDAYVWDGSTLVPADVTGV